MSRRLGGRARQVLDVIYRRGPLSAGDILEEIPDLPSYSAVRSILRSLEQRGLIKHRAEGLRYVYSATVAKRAASRRALAELIDTFFDGAPEPALQSLLDLSRDGRFAVDYERLKRMIDEARREGR